ncbi:hypothetical protein CPB85DRAFT_1441596 [Mucidula mucida]|nr:hypothetical protein CPB85DRAFT_1441596 [Mucidula mucida]
MLQRALLLKKLIQRWVSEKDKLSDLELANCEWTILKHLEKLLAKFTKVTLIMSQSDMPTLLFVLPMGASN